MIYQAGVISFFFFYDNMNAPLSPSAYMLSCLTLWVFLHIYPLNKTDMMNFLSISLLLVVLLVFKAIKPLMFYMYFELSILPIMTIIFLFGYQPEKLDAALFLTLYTVLASLPLLGMILCKADSMLSFVSMFYTIAFMVKTPMYLVHIWLPKAHVQAPVGGSMVLAGILLKLGSYGLFVFFPYITDSAVIPTYFAISLIGGVISSFICARQFDLKSLIAYSSVVHMGSVTLGLCSQSIMGYNAAMFMVMGHGWCSPMMFALAFNTYMTSHTRLLAMTSITVSPIFMALLMCMCMGNMGLPPSLNLWSELWACSSALSIMSSSAAILIIIFFMGVLYNLTLYILVAHTKPSSTPNPWENQIWPQLTAFIMLMLAFICLPGLSFA